LKVGDLGSPQVFAFGKLLSIEPKPSLILHRIDGSRHCLRVVGEKHRVDKWIGRHVKGLPLSSHPVHSHRLTASTHPSHPLLWGELITDSTLRLPLKIVLCQFSVWTSHNEATFWCSDACPRSQERDGAATT
jgi:hypothetical protein